MELKDKKGNPVVKNTGLVVAGAAATKLLEVGCIPLVVGVVAFVATTLWIVKSIKAGKGNLTRKAKILMAALATISTIALIYGVYHKLNCHNLNVVDETTKEVVTEDTTDTKENKPEEVAEPTEEVDSKLEAEASNAGKVTASRGYCPQEDRIEVTYGNVGGSNSGAANSTSTGTTLVDPAKETLHITSDDKKSQDDDLAKDKNKKTEMSDGIISSADEIRPKEDEKGSEDNDKATMDKDNAIETKSEESKKEEPKEEKAEEEKKSEEVVKATDEDLDNMLKQTEKVETTPEMEVVEIDSKAEEPAQKDEEIIEELPEEKTVVVTAIDGYNTNINSTIQFKIDGDNVTIEGLEGVEYTFENGILNIEVGSEATILTVEVSNSSSSVTFDVIVNGIVK